MPADPPFIAQPSLVERLLAALDRVATAQRVGRVRRAAQHGLSRLQADLLSLVATRAADRPRIGDLASWLGMSLSTVSEAVDALERKGLVERAADPADRRAVVVRCTRDGRRVAESLGPDPEFAAQLESTLGEDERVALLVSMLRLIRGLQERGRIPVTRMCITCRFFEPWAHEDDPRRPHHCALVDAPFGDADLRVDCAEWEAADDAP